MSHKRIVCTLHLAVMAGRMIGPWTTKRVDTGAELVLCQPGEENDLARALGSALAWATIHGQECAIFARGHKEAAAVFYPTRS